MTLIGMLIVLIALAWAGQQYPLAGMLIGMVLFSALGGWLIGKGD